jgi:NRPS condensation-like uncharacterized protein
MKGGDQGNFHQPDNGVRYPVNPFDLFSDLICCFSNQIIHMVIHLKGGVDFELLKRAVMQATLAEPVTRCRVVKDNNSLWWEIMPDYSIEDRILHLTTPNPEKLLFQALSYPLNPYLGQIIQVILIDTGKESGTREGDIFRGHEENEEEHEDILVINAHHIAMDGRGLKDFTKLIMKEYSCLMKGSRSEAGITPVNSRLLPKISALASSSESHNTAIETESWCSKISVPLSSREVEKQQYSLLTLSKERMELVHSVRKKWGVTVNDFLIAVLVQVLSSTAREISDLEIPLFTTIDLRRYLHQMPERSVMNYSTAFEVRIPIESGEPLQVTAHTAHAIMNQIKADNPGVDGAREAEQLYEAGYCEAETMIKKIWEKIQKSENKTPLFSNTGIISPDHVNIENHHVHQAYILPTHSCPPGFFFATSTYDNTLTISATYAVPAYDPAVIQNIFSYIDRIIPGSSSFPEIYKVLE